MIKQFTLTAILLCAITYVQAQCGTCTPDSVCLATQPKGVCDSILPDGMVNSAYQHDVSFFMKARVDDAATKQQCSCSHVDLDTIRFQGVSNLPPGMTYEFSKASKKYYPSQGESKGCVRLCGTPVVPGNYVVKINFLADVHVRGISIIGDLIVRDQQQYYTVYINVQPDTSGSVSTFTFGNGPRTTCDSSLSLDFNAVLAAQSPNLTTYSWNFDDGTGSNLKNPGIVTYNTPDTFRVSLTTRFLNYRIKTVYVNVTGGYDNDIEEATTIQSPDPYIKFNALGFSNRGTRTDVKKTSWTNLNLVIPEGTDSIVFEAWDEDTGPPQGTNPFGSKDDALISVNLKVSLDTARFSNDSLSGFVTFDTVLANSVSETLLVVVHPQVPTPVMQFTGDTFCLGQYTPVKISGYKGYAFQWFDDTLAIALANDSIFQAFYTSNLSVKTTSLKTGCSNQSGKQQFVFIPSPPDSLEIVLLPDGRLVNNNFPNSNFSIQWYFNGTLLPGDTDFIHVPVSGAGFYSCEVWHKQNPDCKSTSELFLYTNINDITSDNFKIYPNPFNSNIAIESNESEGNITLTDINSRVVLSNSLQQKTIVSTSELPSGIYLLSVYTSKGVIHKKLIK